MTENIKAKTRTPKSSALIIPEQFVFKKFIAFV